MEIETLQNVKEKLVPILRFKEFRGEWNKRTLGTVAKIITGSTPPTQIEAYYGGNRLFVSPADMQSVRNIKTTKTTLTETGFKKGRKVKKGSVLFVCIGSTIGKVGQAWEECLTNQQINSLEANKENSNNYIYSLLEKNGSKIKLLAGTQAVPQINKTDFSNLSFYFPSLPEQQKIASFLSSFDKKIQKLSRKKELLETYKKGVMQQLFSQEIRFKDEDVKDFPEWEEKKLGNICDVRDGTHDSPKYFEKGYPLITSKNLMADGSIDFANINFISEGDFDHFNKRSLVERGDIIFGMIGTIGNPVIVKNDGFAIKNVALIKEKDVIKNSFLIHYLKSFLILKQFHRQNTGGTQKFIALGTIRSLEISVPSEKEQQKIADFLSAIDKKIEVVSQQIIKTQNFKKGLLQQMFV